MKKTFLTLVLGTAILLSGCASDTASMSSAPETTGTEQELTGSTVSKETSAEHTDPESDNAEDSASRQPVITEELYPIVETVFHSEWTEDYSQLLVQCEYPAIRIRGNRYSKLNAALEKWNSWIKEQADTAREDLLARAQDVLETEPDSGTFNGYLWRAQVYITQANDQCFGFRIDTTEYKGEQLPSMSSRTRSFDPVTGREIPSGQDIPEQSAFAYEIEHAAFQEETEASSLTYFRADVDGDDTSELISVYAAALDEGTYGVNIHVGVSSGNEPPKTLEIPGGYNITNAFLMIPEPGRCYLYTESSSDNDYRYLDVFDLSGEEPFHMGKSYNAFYGDVPLNPKDFILSDRMGLASTYLAHRHFSVGENGMPVPTGHLCGDSLNDQISEDAVYGDTLARGSIYEGGISDRDSIYEGTIYESSTNVTAKRDVPAFTGQAFDEPYTIPSGTKLAFIRTDNQTFVDARDADGVQYRIFIDGRQDWPRTIDGIDLMEYFDGLVFAG